MWPGLGGASCHTPSPQSRARAAAQTASLPKGSVSVTSCALTTRAAAPTTWPSASPKVRSEGLGGPGVPSAAGDSPPPSLSAVTRGDVFLQPDDEYRAYDYHEETRHNTSVQEEQRIPVLLAKTEETPVLKPEEEAPPPGPQTDDLGVSEEELCSGKPFDAFTNLKNGSVFAFRGDWNGRPWD